MATITRSNPGCFKVLAEGLKQLDGKIGRAGWFETSKYEDGTPVAHIAAVQEFGASISHPGGTPYKIGPGGRAVFVTKAEGDGLPVTKPHQIIIPPRPTVRPTITRDKATWLKNMMAGAKKVLRGQITAAEVMEAVALAAAGGIAKTIAELTAPPLKASTVAARRRKMSNNKIVGSLTKPLVATGIMLNTVTGKSEDA